MWRLAAPRRLCKACWRFAEFRAFIAAPRAPLFHITHRNSDMGPIFAVIGGAAALLFGLKKLLA